MLDYQEFVQAQRAMLIAPAGYGKTFTIAECLKHTNGKQLILTHTHAGIASIKAKLQSAGVSAESYNVETITSFAQKYVTAFCNDVIPNQSDPKVYYPFIIETAIKLLELEPVKRVIKSTYGGLFVDEYQDCIFSQHVLVASLSLVLPTRILGDPLQGIFGFHGEVLVDMDDPEHMQDFHDEKKTLTIPWRWEIAGGNKELGESLKSIRDVLLASQPLNISSYKGIEFHQVPESDLYDARTFYWRTVSGLLNSETNILVIHPESSRLEPRIRFLQSFQNRLLLIESIDSKDLYGYARSLDELDRQNPVPGLITILGNVFGATAIGEWFNETGLKRKRAPADINTIAPIASLIVSLQENFSFTTIEKIFSNVRRLPKMKCYRRDLLHSLCVALLASSANGESVFVSMQAHRNVVRRVGRSVMGKCLGTTLLTKGLEFETVVIIDAQNFENREHLYVALTRASKRLVVFANRAILSPYPRVAPAKSQPPPAPEATLFD